jgi:hypothetical protein
LPPEHVPVLQVAPAEHATQLAPAIPHFASLCMENCTHVFPSQQPEQSLGLQVLPPSGPGTAWLHAVSIENTARETQPSRVTIRIAPAP